MHGNNRLVIKRIQANPSPTYSLEFPVLVWIKLLLISSPNWSLLPFHDRVWTSWVWVICSSQDCCLLFVFLISFFQKWGNIAFSFNHCLEEEKDRKKRKVQLLFLCTSLIYKLFVEKMIIYFTKSNLFLYQVLLDLQSYK